MVKLLTCSDGLLICRGCVQIVTSENECFLQDSGATCLMTCFVLQCTDPSNLGKRHLRIIAAATLLHFELKYIKFKTLKIVPRA